MREAQGDLAGAARRLQGRQEIIAKLAAADPGNAGWQRDLSVSWGKLGEVREAQGDLAGALQAYESRKITVKLAAADPGNAGWQRDLATSWEKLGQVREAQGDRAGRRPGLRGQPRNLGKLAARTRATPAGSATWRPAGRSWAMCGRPRATSPAPSRPTAPEDPVKLAAPDPGNAGWQSDLSWSWIKLGDVRQAQGDLAGALQAYEDARALLRLLAEAGKLNADREEWIFWIERQLAALAQR